MTFSFDFLQSNSKLIDNYTHNMTKKSVPEVRCVPSVMARGALHVVQEHFLESSMKCAAV